MSVSGDGETQSTVVLAGEPKSLLLVFQYPLDEFELTSDPCGIVELRSIEFNTLPEDFQKEITRLVDLTTYIQERCPQARVYLIGSTALDICRGTLDVKKAQDRDVLITNITRAEFFQLFYQLDGKPLLESITTKYENVPIKTFISISGYEIVRPRDAWKRIYIQLHVGGDRQHYIDMQIPHAFANPEKTSLADALSALTNGVVALEITPDAFRVMSPFDNALDILHAGPLEAPFPRTAEYTVIQGIRDSIATIEDWVKNSHEKTIGFRTIRELRRFSYQLQGSLDYEYARRISDEVFERIWRCVELAPLEDKRTVLTLFKETGLFTSLYPVTAAAIIGNFQSVTTYLDAHGYTRDNFQTALNKAIHPDVLHPPVLEGVSINGHNSYLEAVQTALGYGPEWVTSMEANFKLLWAFLHYELDLFDQSVPFFEMIRLPAHSEYPDPSSKEQVLIKAHSQYISLLLPFLTSKMITEHKKRELKQHTELETYEVAYAIEESVRNYILFLLLSVSMEEYFKMAEKLNVFVEQALKDLGYSVDSCALRRNDLGRVVWDYPLVPDHVLAQVRGNVYFDHWRQFFNAPFTIRILYGKEFILQPKIFFWYNP